MIAREFQDTIPGVVQKLATLTHALGHGFRVFNTSDNFAEVGMEFENSQKESTMLLIQALRVAGGVQLTFSPWVKSWKGSRLVVPNLAQNEAMAYMRTVFVPALEEMYPRIALEDEKLAKTGLQSLLEILIRFWKGLILRFDNLWTVGLWVLFLFLVFFLPQFRTIPPKAMATPKSQEISACFCQQAWEKGLAGDVIEAQRNACSAKYICVGNAKASCLLQTERDWNNCEF